MGLELVSMWLAQGRSEELPVATLNKELCLKCYTQRRADMGFRPDNDTFNDCWNHGKVRCLYAKEAMYSPIGISSNPPEECPYILEQTVNKNA
jgi:hypothetical protein